MNRKLKTFLCFALLPCTLLAQKPEEKEKKITSLPEARRLLASNLMDNGDEPLKKALSTTNFESAESFSNLLKTVEKNYRTRLDAPDNPPTPDLPYYQQRSKLYGWLTMTKSAEAINDIGGNIDMVWTQDSEGQRILGYPLSKLRNNPRYGLVDSYWQGYARIRKNQVYGFLNIAGIENITCQYEQAESFNDGRALVKKLDWFFVDTNGEESSALSGVLEAKALKWGFSLVKIKTQDKSQFKYAIIDNTFDKSQKPISELYDDIQPFVRNELFIVRLGKKYGLIQIDGKVRLNIEYDQMELMPVPGMIRVEMNRKMGLVDSMGVVRLNPQYDEISNFSVYGLATVREQGNFSLLRSSDLKLSKPYLLIKSFDDQGFAIVQTPQRLFGFINQDFKEVIPPAFTSLSIFNSMGLAPACRQNGQCGFIKRDGTEAIPTKYAEVGVFNKYGLVVVRETIEDCRRNGSKNPCRADLVCNREGKVIIPPAEINPDKVRLQLTDSLTNNYLVVKALVEDNSPNKVTLQYHLIEKNTQTCLTQMPYESIKGYDTHALFMVKKDSKWGLMDTTGKMVAKCLYKELLSASEGLYPVKFDNNKFGFIDLKGKLRVNFEYDTVEPFKSGLAIVSKGPNRMGLIDKFNAKIAPCFFQTIVYNDTSTLELTSALGERILLKSNGDCVQNCQKFDEFLKKANQEGGN